MTSTLLAARLPTGIRRSAVLDHSLAISDNHPACPVAFYQPILPEVVIHPRVLRYLCSLAFGLRALAGQAQTTAAAGPTLYNQVSIASPTAASLGKFTDVPVSYHTGIPDISVPLYTVKEGALTLPISLSYHAGGIKVLEPASWVGMNWALNAGGVITRSVMGAPDERGTTNAKHTHFTDYGYSNYLTIGGVRAGNSSQPGPYDYGFSTNIYDGEPDLFFFNFNGYSGKFYFSDDRMPVVVDGQDIKIEYYYPHPGSSGGLGAGNIQGFILTVPTGDRYYFGTTDAAGMTAAVKPVELTYPSSENSLNIDSQVFSSYYLQKVVAADGVHTIRFEYASEKYSYYTLSTFPISGFDRTPGEPLLYSKKEFALVSNNLDGVRLTGIHFSTGDVTFTANTIRTDLSAFGPGNLDDSQNSDLQRQHNPARALDQVNIKAGSFCKQFTLSYSYYQAFAATLSTFLAPTNTASSSIQSDKTRLRLDKVVEQACDGSQAISPWLFHYNGDYLPRRLSFAQDHWGFYNGAETNNRLNTLISTYTLRPTLPYNTEPVLGTQVPGANRDPALPYMSAGMLTQITYPTGGSVVFKFEPNDVWTAHTNWVTSDALSQTVNPNFTTHTYNYFTFNKKNTYKISVDYYPAKCSAPQQGTALLGFGKRPYPDTYSPDTTLVGAGSALDNQHNTQTFSSATSNSLSGRHLIRFDLTSFACGNDQAVATIKEISSVNVQANSYAGGLRIKTTTIKPSAKAADTVVTRYSYRFTDGHSTGNLYSRPIYVQTVRNDQLALFGYAGDDGLTHPETGGCLNPDNSPAKAYLISPCSIRPLSTTQGSHIGYDVVTVTKADSSRTIYRYADTGVGERTYADVCVRTIDPSLCDPTAPSQPAGPANYEYERGQLKYKSDYNAQWRVVKTIAYHHEYDSTRLVTPAYLAKYIAGAGLNGSYVRRGYWQTKSTVTETLYDASAGAHSTTQIQYFASKFHHQLTRSIQTASTGDTLETRNQYTFDLRTPDPDALDDGNTRYTNTCANCDVTYQNRLKSPVCTTDDCRYNAYLDNLLCRAKARQNYVTYRRQTFTDPLNTFQTRHDAAKSNADASLRPLLQLQDDSRLEVVETSSWKNRRLLGASYTAFSPGLSQPTILYPAQQYSLFLTSPTSTFMPAAVTGNGLVRDARYAATPETSLTFDNGTLIQVLPKTGIVTSYLWGYANTLPIAKAVGVRYTTLQAAYTTTQGDLTALRGVSSLARSGVLLTTYTHQPLVGILSQTDPTGRTITYEYDGLGRLLRTRDDQGRILSQQQYHYAGK